MGLLHAIAAALLLAGVMTFGDYLWAAIELRHRMLYGLAHGAAMCLVLGIVIGWRGRRLPAGAAAGPLIGLLSALAFYVFAPWLGYMAMLPAWMLFWILFAVLQHRMLRTEGAVTTLQRGVAAAILSGVAFYAISGIWTKPAPGGPRYGIHFASWAFAFLPGFIALFIGNRPRR